MSEEKKDGLDMMAGLTGLSREDMKEVWKRVQANHKRLDACPDHDFEPLPGAKPSLGGLPSKYRCKRCNGQIDGVAYRWYVQGRAHEKAAAANKK
jgi:hypothetical protein